MQHADVIPHISEAHLFGEVLDLEVRVDQRPLIERHDNARHARNGHRNRRDVQHVKLGAIPVRPGKRVRQRRRRDRRQVDRTENVIELPHGRFLPRPTRRAAPLNVAQVACRGDRRK